ncbi:ribose 5-phosphate isomerase [Methanoculleus taiwanensis]|uniref:Ribose-5-phosphate isomerase A n=1 Tax=Methanoculleus taiwanensis TaxID=1550565 RepID=A0A498GYP3_9EURY|nr:ribose-5-phosphate isomerase RpiA [Methanoculleus taiwanensis]RXE55528.1 ribose 5-phosphate isomerase [Methanoculleus taiwanensis]
MDSSLLAESKRIAGYRAADLVEDGTVIGLGTGSTVFFAMERLAERIASGLSIVGVPTSYQAAIRAREYGIPLTTLDEFPQLALAIDGADQVDPGLSLIKGRGAAHLREKCVADAAEEVVIVVDSTKTVDTLSAPVPIEVLPFACGLAFRRLTEMGGVPVLREGVKKDGPVVTDNGNFIIDCNFGAIPDPASLEQQIAAVPGLLECGLFTTFAEKMRVVVGEGRECRIVSLH